MSSHDTMNLNGGVTMGHVMESSDPNERLLSGCSPGKTCKQHGNRSKPTRELPEWMECPIEAFPAFARNEWEQLSTMPEPRSIALAGSAAGQTYTGRVLYGDLYAAL